MRRRILFGGLSVINYSDWEIEILADSTTISNIGGTVNISATAHRYVYWSDNTVTIENTIPSISVSEGIYENGVLTVGANSSTSVKNIIVTATQDNIVAQLYLTQAGKTIDSYDDWEITVSANPSTGISASGGIVTIMSSAQRTLHWSDGSTTVETVVPTLSSTDGELNYNVLTLYGNDSTSEKTITITATHQGKSATCTVTQNADVIRAYSDITLVVGSIEDVSASGGSKTSTGSSATQILTWLSGRTTTIYPTIVEGTISNVTSRGVEYGERQSVGFVTIQAIGQGDKTASKQLEVFQEANIITELEITSMNGGTITAPATYSAGGETKTVSNSIGATCGCNVKFSSNEISSEYGTWVNITTSYSWSSDKSYATLTSSNAQSLDVKMANRTTTVGDARSATITRTATFTASLKEGYVTASATSSSINCTVKVTQEANVENASSAITVYGTPSISIGSGITAAGGSATVTHSVNNTKQWYYTSKSEGKTESVTGTSTIAITSNGNSRFSLSGNKLSHSSMGKNVVTDTCVVTATNANDSSKTKTASVSASNTKSSITYGTPSINSFSYSTKTAAQGTVSPSYSYSQSRVQNYDSGSTEDLSALTSGASLSFSETTAHANASVNSSTGVVTWDANQTTSARSVGITMTVTMNGKSASKATTSTQSADSVSSTSWGNVTAGTITNATIPASGGTGTAKAANGSQSYTQTWVSGRTTTGSNSVSPSSSSYSATASSKGTTASSTTTVGSKGVTWSGSGSKSASGTMYVYQEANSATLTGTSGGGVTYNNVTAGTITNATIGADGGSGTAKAGNGSQTWSKAITYNNYKWTSGDTSSSVKENASSGTNSIAPSSSSYTASANSKGTTVSSTTTVGSKAVTWSGSGGKSASGTMYVYQAANSSSYSHQSFIAVNNTNVASSGSTSVTIKLSGEIYNVYKYTSGSTSQTFSANFKPIITNAELSGSSSYARVSYQYSAYYLIWNRNNTGNYRYAAVNVTYYSSSYSQAAGTVTITCSQEG